MRIFKLPALKNCFFKKTQSFKVTCLTLSLSTKTECIIRYTILKAVNYFIYASIAGLMGRNRGHWPEFQIRPDISSRAVLMVYM